MSNSERIAELEKRVAALEQAARPESIKKLAHEDFVDFLDSTIERLDREKDELKQ